MAGGFGGLFQWGTPCECEGARLYSLPTLIPASLLGDGTASCYNSRISTLIPAFLPLYRRSPHSSMGLGCDAVEGSGRDEVEK